jgi:DNA-binding MurR/RpiR family transcriptional regulator
VSGTLNDAARELGMGVTALKKKCRKLGFRRWPYRQIKSLDSLSDHLQEIIRKSSGSYEHFQIVIEHIQFHRNKILNNPCYKIPGSILKLRQRDFKQKYNVKSKR